MKKICPKCLSKDSVIPIRYGMPGIEMQNEYHEGKIKLGGCMVYEESPNYHCKDCKYEWPKRRPKEGLYGVDDL